MRDDSVYGDENTPSSFSGDSGIEIERHAVFRHHKPALPVGSRSIVSDRSGRESLKSVSPPPRDIFPQTRTGPITIFNKRRQRKAELRRKDDALYFSTENGKPWLSYTVVGGLRQDPFNALPVEPHDCIPNAVDHFVQIFIPERILRPFNAVPGIQNLAHDYFHLVINDVCVFEATVAQSQASFVAQQGIRRPTKEVLHHHGKALIHLQEKLADPVLSKEDATIHAILAIMGTHFFFGELDAHQSHLDGLWSLIRMRGGIETLGWNGTLRQAVETVTSFRAYTAKHETPAPSPDLSRDTTTPTTGKELDYPSHPFSPQLSETIARLPPGFTDLALDRTLSLQMINLLLDLHEQQQRPQSQLQPAHPPSNDPNDPPRHHIYTADKALYYLHSHPSMPELERMICIGLLAYTISSYPHPHPTSARTRVYDDFLQQYFGEMNQYTFFNYSHDSLLWVVFCFAGVQDHLFGDENGAHFFHHTIMRFKQSNRWERVEGVLKRFLWTEGALGEWRVRYEECVSSHRPGGSRSNTPATMGVGRGDGKGSMGKVEGRVKSESPG